LTHSHDPVGVVPAVLQPARQREQSEPLGAGCRAFRARQHQRDIAVGMRAEPFVAAEPPLAFLEVRGGLDGAEIRAAGALGHELRALPHRGDVAGQHPGQEVVLELRAGEFADQMERGVGDADRAHQPELGLHEQILQCVFGNSWQRTVHAQRAGAVAHEMKPKSPKAMFSISR
jgi:hypothetical protein